jgi:putative DNA primase/helicase
MPHDDGMPPADGAMPDGAETVRAIIAAAEDVQPDDDAEIARLAALPLLAYDREREAAAKRLGIRRVSILDKAVAAVRGNGGTTPSQGRPLDFPEIAPWPELANGAELLDELARAIRQYVVLDAHEADAIALWVLGVHAFDAWTIFPRLFVTAPERQCGKSTLLDVLSPLVPRAQTADSITAAALFRTIEAARPTLLLDEADTYARDNEDLRGVLDSGHKRSGSVVRTVGDNHLPRRFSTWAPVALAAIGHLPGTVEDRSIIIRLRRRRPDEAIESLRQGRTRRLDTLARKAARWVADNAAALAAADPAMPAGLYNRVADNWHPLLAIADAAGGGWPERARHAAVTLTRDGAEDGESVKVKLLADIHAAFMARGTDRMTSGDLVAYLTGLDERPWPDYRNGKPITKAQIARLLKPLRISSGSIRLDDGRTPKGYYRAAFEDAFRRYIHLPGFQNATTPQAKQSAALDDSQNATSSGDVAFRNRENPSVSAGCGGVAFRNPQSWRDDVPDRWRDDGHPEEAVWTE